MRYILLILSIILILYPIFAIIRCLEAISTLSNYGAGVLFGGLILVFTGVMIFYLTVRSLKQKKNEK